MRQVDFAQRLGISQQQLHKYETGRSRLSAARLYEISEMLGAPITAFFAGSGSSLEQHDAIDGPARPQAAGRSDVQALLDRCLTYLSPAEQKAITDLAISIAESHGFRPVTNGRDGMHAARPKEAY